MRRTKKEKKKKNECKVIYRRKRAEWINNVNAAQSAYGEIEIEREREREIKTTMIHIIILLV